MTLREAAQQALEAIDWLRLHLQRDHQCLHMDPAQSGIPAWISRSETNLRAALAEPVQEPVAWMIYTEGGTSAYVTDNPNDLVGAYRALALYTTPPQRKPLTEEEIEEMNRDLPLLHMQARKGSVAVVFARAIEKAHGIGDSDD